MSKKSKGQIFTPEYLVKDILNFAHYCTKEILRKNIIDHSCGTGAFLKEVVFRYCSVFLEYSNNLDELKQELQLYIHGIELDKDAYIICINDLNQTVEQFGLADVHWDILNTDALSCTKFNGKMDFVVGNPPYVRVHNLEDYDAVKSFSFADNGMTDLYIVFFELGFNMLSPIGIMCIITPSSWLSSGAGKTLRKYISSKKNLSGIIDLEHFQAFEATTYTMISRFESINQNLVEYNTYNGEKHFVGNLLYEDFIINDKFYFLPQNELRKISKLYSSSVEKRAFVKNGFATLADKIFIGNFDFSECTIDVIKASSGKWFKCFYPYDKDGKPLSLEFIKEQFPSAYNYIITQKEILLKRDAEDSQNWHLFGRTQALSDVKKYKIAINSIIKDIESIKLNEVHSGKGVYSGLYILTDIDFSRIESILKSDEFIQYVKALKNYKSGGYYTFSSKELELYINYKIGGLL